MPYPSTLDPSAPSPAPQGERPPRQWQVGTLTYTAGGLATLFVWLLFGDFAMYMRERAAVPTVMELLRQYNASSTTMSILVTAFPAVIWMVLVPAVSYRSDRHRGPRGRRIPFLLLPTPIGALAMIGLGCSPWLGAQIHAALGTMSPGLDFCVLALFCVFWTVFECVAIMTLELFTALINDVVPKPMLGRFYGAFRAVSLGAGVIFNLWIFKLTETHLFEIFVSIGLLFGVGFTLMCAKVKEGEYPPPPEQAEGGGFIGSARTYLTECFTHPYYRWCFAVIAIGMLAPSPFNTFYQWYADSLGMPKQRLGELLAYSFTISIVLAYGIGWLVDRFNALRISILMLLLAGTAYIGGFVFVSDVPSFSVVFMLHTVLSGAFYTAVGSLPMMLFPKLRFSQFASAANMMRGLAVLLVSLIQGPVIDWSGRNYKLALLGSGVFAFMAAAFGLLLLRRIARNQEGDLP